MKQVTGPALGGRLSQKRHGLTLTEVLITMVVLGILLGVALPSYQSSMRKSRRAEAFTALSNIQQAQERHRSTNATFATSITNATTATPPGLGLTTPTPSGYYSLSIASADGTSYVATATAAPGTSQANDGVCSVLSVRMQGGNISYGAGATIDWSDATRCWAR